MRLNELLNMFDKNIGQQIERKLKSLGMINWETSDYELEYDGTEKKYIIKLLGKVIHTWGI